MPFQEILTMLGSLAIVIAVIFLVYYGARTLGGRTMTTSSRNLQVIERIPLGPDRALLLVRVCGEYLLLGATAHRIERLGELTPEQAAALEESSSGQDRKNGAFSSALAAAIAARLGGNKTRETEQRGKESGGGDDEMFR